jgi:hypothetical protein
MVTNSLNIIGIIVGCCCGSVNSNDVVRCKRPVRSYTASLEGSQREAREDTFVAAKDTQQHIGRQGSLNVEPAPNIFDVIKKNCVYAGVSFRMASDARA